MARLRDYPQALSRLEAATQVQHPEQTVFALSAAVQEIGRTAAAFCTPQELSALQTFLEKQKASATPQETARIWMPLAQNAGLSKLEAQWRFERMMADPGGLTAPADERRLINLENQRMKYDELGAELEKYWNVYPFRPDKDRLLTEAATAYRAGEDTRDELRVLDIAFSHGALGGNTLDRYFHLLLSSNPAKLVEIARTANTPTRDAAANFVLASGDRGLALQTVSARGWGLPPVWTHAYMGLTGFYYSDKGAAVDEDFREALGGGTIGERVGKPVDRNENLAGDLWYYYGSRYGEFLTLARNSRAEDYLPALLEATPASPHAYFFLAGYYAAANNPDRALAEYSHTLELAPNRGDADDRMAQILLRQGKRQQATARWKLALEAFNRQQNFSHAPPEFWQNVQTTLKHIGAAKMLAEVRPTADELLRVYIHRNGAYQVEPLLQGVMKATGDPTAGVAWILDLSQVAPNPMEFLGGIADAQWIPEANRRPIYEGILSLAKTQVTGSFGAARTTAEASLNDWEMRWIGYLLEVHETAQAQSALDAIPEATRKALSWQIAPLQIRMASRQGKLESLLRSYRENPAYAPADAALRSAAMALHKDGDETSARRVLEFMYSRAIDRRDFAAANFLGLAELRLESGDVGKAVALLQRMTLIAGNPFQTLMDAGSLLARHGHPTEAAEFFSERAKAAPWDLEARLLLAKAELAANRNNLGAAQILEGLAGNRQADYGLRAEAATALAPLHVSGHDLGSTELNLLAAGKPVGVQAASQPFFVRARIEAAAQSGDPQEKMALLRDAIAIKPDNDTARIEFFRTAYATGHNQLAISAMEPLLYPRPNNGQPEAYHPRPVPRFTIAELATRNYSSFLSGIQLGPAQKSTLARNIGHAYEKLGTLGEAGQYLRTAALLEPSKAMKAQIEKESHVIAAKVNLTDRDAQRRPFVSVQLSQRNVVRPRLLPVIHQKAAGRISP
jgi:tetratricopeptide (TPR) repeat protein